MKIEINFYMEQAEEKLFNSFEANNAALEKVISKMKRDLGIISCFYLLRQ